GLNAFFLLLAKPSTYNLPENPKVPQRNVVVDSLLSIGSAVLVGLGALLAFRDRGGGDGGGHALAARVGDEDRPVLLLRRHRRRRLFHPPPPRQPRRAAVAPGRALPGAAVAPC